MSNKTDGGPAFPIPGKTFHYPEGKFTEPDYIGMSLRDYFAAKALQGLLSSDRTFGYENETRGQAAAKNAYQYADAMLAERDK